MSKSPQQPPSQQEPPKIEFPCDYSIRVMGDKSDEFINKVFEIIQLHAPELKRDSVKSKDSSKGRFMSVHVVIVATGEDQLGNIHQSLQAYDAVKMVI